MAKGRRAYRVRTEHDTVLPPADPEALRADLERRRSNAARPMPSRTERKQRDRRAKKDAAIKEQS